MITIRPRARSCIVPNSIVVDPCPEVRTADRDAVNVSTDDRMEVIVEKHERGQRSSPESASADSEIKAV